MREDARTKATRLLVEGRVAIRRVDHQHVVARVRGEGEDHEVTFDGAWSCSCPARSRCSHQFAVMRVVTIGNSSRRSSK